MAIQTAAVPESIPFPARTLSNIIKILFRLTPAQIDGLLEQGYVTLNGRTKRQGWAKCEVGDKISIDVVPQSIVAPVKQTKKKSGSRTIEFLYDDEDLSLVNKPANLLTVPTKHREAHTVISLVERRYQSKDPKAKAYCVHRLDRGVSGVLAIAKSLEMAERIRDQFAARKPKRKYIAIVAGKPPQPAGRLVNYLSTDEDLNRIIVPDETHRPARRMPWIQTSQNRRVALCRNAMASRIQRFHSESKEGQLSCGGVSPLVRSRILRFGGLRLGRPHPGLRRLNEPGASRQLHTQLRFTCDQSRIASVEQPVPKPSHQHDKTIAKTD